MSAGEGAPPLRLESDYGFARVVAIDDAGAASLLVADALGRPLFELQIAPDAARFLVFGQTYAVTELDRVRRQFSQPLQ